MPTRCGVTIGRRTDRLTFQRKLTDKQVRELLVDHQDGWKVKELSIIYRVSVRTVYRILAENDRPTSYPKQRRKRVKPKRKEKPELKPCGTNAAYQRHRRRGEYPCPLCLAAHAENVKNYKK